MKKTHGGQRNKSGRKPVSDPKKGITIYVHKSIIADNGGEDICKTESVKFLTKRAVRQKKKTRLFIAPLFALLVSTSVNAQWFQQSSFTNGDLYSVHCIDDNTCYAVGAVFNVRKTTDGGATNWVTGGTTAGGEDKLVVKMLNKDTILLGLDNGCFRITTNGSTGSQWSNVIYGGNTNFGIYDIFYHSNTNFTAVGGSMSNTSTGGHITTTTTNTSATWTSINVSGEPTMFGLHAINTNTFVAVGGAKTIFRSTDAGVTWAKIKTGGTDTSLFDINFPTPDTGYAVGGTPLTPATGGIIFMTKDTGKTWTNISTGLAVTNTLYGVHFVNGKTGYVVGNGGTIQVTTDGGANWTKQISPVSTDLNKIYFPSKLVGYIIGRGGVILKTTNGGFIAPLIVNAGTNSSVCPGFCATIGSQTVAVGGTPPYTYSWSPVTNTNSSLVVCPTVKTTYTLTVTDVNSISSTGTVSVSVYNVAAVSFSGLPTKYCRNGSNISLAGSPTGGVFSGSAGITGTSLNPIIAGSGTHTVSYTYTDTHGCIKTSLTKSVTITSVPAKGSLCMVTVDSVNPAKNIIVWQKPVSTLIDKFNIYVKNSSGVLTYTASVAYAANPLWTDNGANPNIKSYCYAISIVDTCGVESALSDTNSTIFLDVPEFATPNKFTLKWKDYTGFIPTEYEIWRKDDAISPWAKIATVPYSIANSYPDLTFPPNTSRYRIRAVNPSSGCPIDASTTLFATISNISGDFTGVSEISLSHLLSIYPNPNNGSFTFRIEGIKYQTSNVKVYDMVGKVVYESNVKNQKSEISIPGIAPGIYQLQVITDKGIANKKVIVQ